jgi:hypothetical protein
MATTSLSLGPHSETFIKREVASGHSHCERQPLRGCNHND